MALTVFVGNSENRLDSKNRLSIPAGFREILKRLSSPTEPLQLYASPDLDPYSGDSIIQCYSEAKITKLEEEKLTLDPFHPRHIEIRGLQSLVRPLAIDGEGRVQLPDGLRDWLGITDTVAVVGTGDSFYFSSPEAFTLRRERELRETKERFATLRQARLTAQAGGGS
ncbi:MAG: hypothetical protein QM523_02865 [Candidatus Pacebacteria bacterium]|nr:hypothetical protein [Candidatus Paceibacterota bacterium]